MIMIKEQITTIGNSIMTPEAKILMLVNNFKESGKIRFKKEFYDSTGISRQYMRMVEHEDRRFTSTQIKSVCKEYNINANWIFDLEKNIFRQ